MFQLDDKFLQDVGLGDLPDQQKQAFLQHIYQELELRVGTKLSEGLTESQMAEFEAFVDQKEDKVLAWFEDNMPDYAEKQDFVQLQASAAKAAQDSGKEISQLAILSEYGSLKWLEINRPDYKQVVAKELEILKSEVTKSAPSILETGESDDSATGSEAA